MSTVDYSMADRIAGGEYAEDGFTQIVAYRTAWDTPAYKLLGDGQVLLPSEYIRNQRLVWQLGETQPHFRQRATQWECEQGLNAMVQAIKQTLIDPTVDEIRRVIAGSIYHHDVEVIIRHLHQERV